MNLPFCQLAHLWVATLSRTAISRSIFLLLQLLMHCLACLILEQ
jgi:hypothetical protein